MEKKIPFGIVIFGSIMLLYSLWLLDSILIFKPLDSADIKLVYQMHNFLYIVYPFQVTHTLLKFGLATLFISIAYLMSSIAILKLNKWGRLVAVSLSYITVGLIILVLLPVLIQGLQSGFSESAVVLRDFYWNLGFALYMAIAFFPAFLFLLYFTHPKVKQQFTTAP